MRDLDMSDVEADAARMDAQGTQSVSLVVSINPAGQPDQTVADDIRTALLGLAMDTPYEVTDVRRADRATGRGSLEDEASKLISLLEAHGYQTESLGLEGLVNVFREAQSDREPLHDLDYLFTLHLTRTPGY